MSEAHLRLNKACAYHLSLSVAQREEFLSTLGTLETKSALQQILTSRESFLWMKDRSFKGVDLKNPNVEKPSRVDERDHQSSRANVRNPGRKPAIDGEDDADGAR